jgi:hypothetical protein
MDNERFSIQERPSGCGPRVSEFVELVGESRDKLKCREKHLDDANRLLGESSAELENEPVLARGEWYEAVAQMYKEALLRGECSEHQVVRLVRLKCR